MESGERVVEAQRQGMKSDESRCHTQICGRNAMLRLGRTITVATCICKLTS